MTGKEFRERLRSCKIHEEDIEAAINAEVTFQVTARVRDFMEVYEELGRTYREGPSLKLFTEELGERLRAEAQEIEDRRDYQRSLDALREGGFEPLDTVPEGEED